MSLYKHLRGTLFVFLFLLCTLPFSYAGVESRTLNPPRDNNISNIQTYPVNRFEFAYGKTRLKQGMLEALSRLTLNFSYKDGIYLPPNSMEEQVEISLGQLPQTSNFSLGALRYLLAEVVRYWNNQGFEGTYVSFDPKQINPYTANDLRSPTENSLRLISQLVQVGEIYPMDAETGKPMDAKADQKSYATIMEGMPIKTDSPNIEDNLFKRKELENYIRRINRHPRRNVKATLAPSDQIGQVVLNLFIDQEKPYVLYSQVSNNGTESTGDWRGRIGFIHHQLTGNDDIFSLDYISSGFNKSNAALGSYQLPLLHPNYLKARVYGSWSEYKADEVGVSSVEFKGKTTETGIEFIASPLQYKDYYLDLQIGASLSDITVNNKTLVQVGRAKTLIPYAGVSLGRRNFLRGFYLGVTAEGNNHPISSEDLTNLGRVNTEDTWMLAKINGRAHVYLEPLLFGNSWKDRATWYTSTLAHEVALRVQGQHTFNDNRIIPQENIILGGANSVRGYPESVASGDNGFLISGQYRFHLPRVLKPASEIENYSEEGRPTWRKGKALRPASVYSLPDWDFVIKLFADYAETTVNKKEATDDNHTLLSAGAGVELRWLSNISLNVDWGHVLKSLERAGTPVEDADEGNERVHLTVTGSW